MRTAPYISDLWNAGGPFIGVDGRPNGRVTVEEGWELTATGITVGNYGKGPIRWFQRKDNSQTETEIPNIKTIAIGRDLSTDAAQCTITIQNQKMFNDGDPATNVDELGQPGYYTFNRGESTESQDRWGQTTNEWNQVLVPNALLRTYQGYGGWNSDGTIKTIPDSITDGNLLQTGLWLIDQVQPQANGDLVLTCRDMAKLLIDQSLFPPLIPKQLYPLYYYRWKNLDHPPIPYGTTVYGAGYNGVPAGETSTGAPSLQLHSASSTESGFPGANAVDFGDATSYWLSAGQTTEAGWAWIELDPHGGGTVDMGAYDMIPWGGGYDMFISVSIDGVWQGDANIPGAPSGMDIPYVQQTTTQGWERPFLQGIKGGPYIAADHIRFTFTGLVQSSLGPNFYRAGIRDLTVGTYTGTLTSGGRVVVGMARPYDVDGGLVGADSTGYWIAGSDGGVYSFGSAKFWGSLGGQVLAEPVTGIASQGLNGGYWLVGSDGGVFAFHGAHFFGSLPADSITPVAPICAIARSALGQGYYLAGQDGGVFAYGDATFNPANGSLPALGVTPEAPVISMAVKPGGGYWLVDQDGSIYAFAGASYYGGANTGDAPAGSIVGMSATSTGLGYWLVGGDGAVYAYGDANFHGGANDLALNDPICDIQGYADDDGYWLVAQDGGVFAYPIGGERNFWGSLPQSFDIETTGNYADWSDIIRDMLLWSGFWLEDGTLTSADAPEVFGNIEQTGTFAPDNITEDFFDKKAVIDVLHTIREIVGYLIYVDDQGGFHFHPPNLFAIGNFDEEGVATDTIPQIADDVIITDYQVAFSDKDAATSITITSDNPSYALNTTVTTTRPSPTGTALLKGIVKNAIWSNGVFTSKDEQEALAELVDLYLFLAERQGQLQIWANPAINLDDQVRIFERQTAETYMHYVSGISSSMDLVAGTYTMTLTTHWLGDGTAWFLTYD